MGTGVVFLSGFPSIPLVYWAGSLGSPGLFIVLFALFRSESRNIALARSTGAFAGWTVFAVLFSASDEFTQWVASFGAGPVVIVVAASIAAALIAGGLLLSELVRRVIVMWLSVD